MTFEQQKKINERRPREIESEGEIKREGDMEPRGTIGEQMQKLRQKISGVKERIWKANRRQRETAKQDAESLQDANSWATNETEELDTIHQDQFNTSKEKDQLRRQREDENGQIEKRTGLDPSLEEVERIIDLWVEKSCRQREDERTTALQKPIVISDTSLKSRTKRKTLKR